MSESAPAWRTELYGILPHPVEQVKSWGISCILRAHTDAGDVYFKVASSLPLFGHEPALMRGLSALYPDDIPAPLSIDAQRRWMLLADFGAPIGWKAPVETQEAMLHRYGGLQRDAASRLDDLLALGCIDRCASCCDRKKRRFRFVVIDRPVIVQVERPAGGAAVVAGVPGGGAGAAGA
jgi:hypothetical protein